MSELQAYYEAFCTGYWANPDEDRCQCRGSGWALSEVDTWHACPAHYKGQPHPEDYDYEGNMPRDTVPTSDDTVPTPAPTFDENEEVPF